MHLKSRRRRHAILSLSVVLIFSYAIQAQQIVSSGQSAATVTILDSSKEEDGLVGSVRRVKTESARLEVQAGQVKEGPLRVLEITTYDLKGKRLENTSYPILSSTVGKEEYRYDTKGNIVEMTLRSDDGSILSREAYDYEFDRFGNWKKMVTNLVVFEAGELKREPVEVTYRTFTYYFDDAVATVVGSLPSPTVRTNPSLPHSRGLASDYVGIAAVVGDGVPKNQLSIDLNEAPPDPPAIRVEHSSKAEPLEKRVSAETDSPRTQPVSFAPTLDKTPPTESAKTTETTEPANEASGLKTAHDFYNEGRANLDSGDLKGAVNSFLKSLEIEPKSAAVHLGLGHAYLTLKNYGEAAKAFKEAVALNPEMAEAHYGLGLISFNRKQYPAAAQSFKRAVAFEPSMAKGHFGLALAYQQMGDQDRLMTEFRTLQNLDPALAKKLGATFPQFNLPCRAAPFCR